VFSLLRQLHVEGGIPLPPWVAARGFCVAGFDLFDGTWGDEKYSPESRHSHPACYLQAATRLKFLLSLTEKSR
jgi:hypothetical protein